MYWIKLGNAPPPTPSIPTRSPRIKNEDGSSKKEEIKVRVYGAMSTDGSASQFIDVNADRALHLTTDCCVQLSIIDLNTDVGIDDDVCFSDVARISAEYFYKPIGQVEDAQTVLYDFTLD